MSKLATRTIASRPEDDPAHPARRRRGLAQAWADRSLRLKGLVVVAIPLLTLVFLAPVYSWSQGKAQDASALVVHTLEVRSEIERVQNLYQDTSLRTRGYLLTGSKDFLTPYEASVSAIPSALTQLRTLVRDNPSQLQRVDTLTPLGTSFLAVLERLHEDFRPGHVTPEEVTLVNRTRIQLDGIRSILDRMRNEESQLLAVRRGSEADASRTASIVIAVSIPLALLIGVGAILLFTAGIGRRVQQVAENARRLQREEPLLPLPPAADEIGALGRTLEEAAALLMQRRGALARSEERYRTLARNLPKGIVAMFDRDLRYTMVEGPGLPSLGLSREALEGKTLQETAEPHNIAVVEPHYRGTLEGRTSVFELPVRGRTLLLHFLPLEDEEGAVTAGMVVALDITDRKAAEEQAVRLQAFLNSVVENIPNMIFVKDAQELRFVRFNRAGEELIGLPRDELIGKTDHDFFPKPDADAFTEKDREVLRGRSVVDIPEEPLQTANGARVLHTKKIPILNEDGEPEYLLGISEDITERRRAEEDLRRAKEQAERASSAKDEFLSRMSHELRTPLNSVLGFAQLLEMDPLDAPQRDSVRQILHAGRHLLALIDEVLDISRISSGGLSLSLEPIGLGDTLREAVELVMPLAVERGIRIEMPEVNGLHVLADHQRLKQVLLNLLSNGVKYNSEHGRIDVGWERSDGLARVRVSDTGPGIPADRIDRLFTPFDRLGADQTGIEGAGLGLALSRSLMEAMGGTLQAESRPGAGSTFSIELPVTTSVEKVRDTARSEESAHLRAGNHSVLYVEDNAANLSLIEAIFDARPGVRLLTAIQGRLGLDLAREHHPDAILLDLHLPDIPGQEVLKELKRDPSTRDIPVVVISADATESRIRSLIEAGADEYLTKPLEVKRFLETLDALL